MPRSEVKQILALCAVLLGLVATPSLYVRTVDAGIVDLPKKSETLAREARRIAESQVGKGWVHDHTFGWVRHSELPDHLLGQVQTAEVPVLFWFRSSPKDLIPEGRSPQVQVNNPPQSEAGMVTVLLSPHSERIAVSELLVVPRDKRRLQPLRLVIWLLGNLAMILGFAYGIRTLITNEGDSRAAFWLATFYFVTFLTWWLLKATHITGFGELVAHLFAFSVFILLAYRGFERFVDRWSQGAVDTWTQLLHGEFRAPQVGRDALLGAAAGVMLTVSSGVAYVLTAYLTRGATTAIEPIEGLLDSLRGSSDALASYFELLWSSLRSSLQFLSFFVLLRMVFRYRWLAVTIFFLVNASLASGVALSSLAGTSIPASTEITVGLVSSALVTLVLVRCGLLALFSMHVFGNVGTYFVLATDPSSWFFIRNTLPLVLLSLTAVALFQVWTQSRILMLLPKALELIVRLPAKAFVWLDRATKTVQDTPGWRVFEFVYKGGGSLYVAYRIVRETLLGTP